MLLSNCASVIVTVSAEEGGATPTWVEIVLPFADVVTVTVQKLLTRWALIWTGAPWSPAGIVTDAGADTIDGSELVNVTTVPPVGAGLPKMMSTVLTSFWVSSPNGVL